MSRHQHLVFAKFLYNPDESLRNNIIREVADLTSSLEFAMLNLEKIAGRQLSAQESVDTDLASFASSSNKSKKKANIVKKRITSPPKIVTSTNNNLKIIKPSAKFKSTQSASKQDISGQVKGDDGRLKSVSDIKNWLDEIYDGKQGLTR